ncbi:hypothetical protein [Fluviicola sp.]|uniref:hypothetical protein n=1 Tax=Fluviicola sp. TaxID=1917219 RepID=UPI0031DF5FDB
MKSLLLFLLFFGFYSFVSGQEIVELKGEVDFPWINRFSAYGLPEDQAEKELAGYEHAYKKAQRKNRLTDELRLYALLKENNQLYAPYVSIRNDQEKPLVIYMDSASYKKTGVWNYNEEDLTRKQQFLFFEAKGYPIGENAYLLTEFIQIREVTDPFRSKALSKFAMDVYRK